MSELMKTDDQLLAMIESQQGTQKWTEGLEDDIARPKFVRLINHASRAIIPGSDSYVEDLKAGDFAILNEKIILGKELKMIICGTRKDYVQLDKDPPEGKFIARHSKKMFAIMRQSLSKDDRQRYHDEVGNCFVETCTIYFLDLNHLELGGLCMSFTSSAIRAWRDITSRASSAKKKLDSGRIVSLDMTPWACVWTIGSKTEVPNVGNPYLLPDVKGNFEMLPSEHIPMAIAAFEQVQTALRNDTIEEDHSND